MAKRSSLELVRLDSGKTLHLPAKLAYEDWEQLLVRLVQIEARIQFAIGDLLVYGERTYGRRFSYREVTEMLARAGVPRTTGTLRNYAWVSKAIPASLRNDKLGWWHHREVVRLRHDPELQRRWLERAAEQRMGVRALRAALMWPERIDDGGTRAGEEWELLCADVCEIAERLPPDSFAACVTDPPYSQPDLYGVLGEAAAKLLVPGGIVCAFASVPFLYNVMQQLAKSLEFLWCCAVDISGPIGETGARPLLRGWKPMVVFTNGDAAGYQGPWFQGLDLLRSQPVQKRVHPHQMDLGVVRRVIELLTYRDAHVFDPFCGSGTVGVACLELGRSYVGSDSDERALAVAAERLREADGARELAAGGSQHGP
jgi:hypothetical protein